MTELLDQEVVPLPGATDWRIKERRREAFQDFYEMHTSHGVHPGLVYMLIPYLSNYYDWDDEQLLWFAFLNGNTQHPLTSLLLHRAGSRPSEAEGTLAFYYEHRHELGWDTDRRYHRPYLEQAIRGYIQMLDYMPQREFWDRAEDGGWKAIWQAATAIPTFGRLSAWSYCDYLHICGVEVNCEELFLEDRDGSRSHRNGICKVAGLDVYDWHQSNPDFNGNYPPVLLDRLDTIARELLTEAQARAKGQPWERDVNLLTLESALCTYKSWFRPNRRYPGVYADMLYDRITKTERAFPDHDFEVFWAARAECLPKWLRHEDMPGDPGLSPIKQNWYRLCGEIPVMGRQYPKYLSGFDEAVDRHDWGEFP